MQGVDLDHRVRRQRCLSVRQVSREDELGFENAEDQADGDDVADDGDQLPGDARRENERRERSDRGERAEYDRYAHLGRAVHGCDEPVLALLLVRVHALANDDGVVHDNAEHQDEGDHRHRADGDAEGAENRDGAQYGNGNPGRNPHGHPELQQQGQQKQHQRQPGCGRTEKNVNPRPERLGLVPRDGQFDAFGHAQPGCVHVAPHPFADLEQVFIADPVDPHDSCRLAIEARLGLAFPKPVHDR